MIHVGGNKSAFVGFNKKTGEIIWQSGNSTVGHSSPFTAVINDVEQYVFTISKVIEKNGKKQTVNEAVAVSNDGNILWTGPDPN